MYSQNCERVVYRRRYIQNTMRQRKASKKQTLKSHPARRINHGIIPLLISSVSIRYVQIVSTLQKKKKKEGTIVNLIASSGAQKKKGRRKGKRNLSPTKPPLNAPSNPSENPTTLLLLLELDGDSRRSRNRNQSRSDRRRHGLTRGSAFLRRRHG
jgi:hypothetical protein